MEELDPASFAQRYVDDLARVMAQLPMDSIAAMMGTLCEAHRGRRQVFLVGNGGSAATASHWQSDLTWGLLRAGLPAMRALSLTDNVPVITAIANDRSYEAIFVHQLEGLAERGDVLLAISASGNSPNVVRAVEWARQHGLTTLAVLGMTGGRVRELADVAVVVPATGYGPIEDLHMVLDHLALDYLRVALRP
jgi:D-sedoheptulose 7-phosphate isomerase